MLIQLSISNFAIIKHLDISFRAGLNILSGETGTGKSIIINAMNLLLGSRATSDLIRSGCNEARVEALFTFPQNRFLKEMLSDLGFLFDGELFIKRTIFREGRNRIFINGSMATLQMLSRLGPLLVSISGQHEHQLLLKPDNHLYLLDDFGGLAEERQALSEVYARYLALKEESNGLRREINEIGERQDLTRFQIQEIEGAMVVPGEDKSLAEERRRLQHAEELLAIASEGYQALYEKSDSVLSLISQYRKKMEKGATIDPRLDSARDALGEIEARLEDTSLSLRDFQQTIHMDPRKLEEVAERLELLNGLKRKYGSTLEEVLKFKDRLASTMYDLDEKTERLRQLREKQQELEEEIRERAAALSGKRKEAAASMESEVEEELDHLHMADTRFEVKFDRVVREGREPGDDLTGQIRAEGWDRVEFMISPNVGEELRPLSRIASGGELSRIMLALKTILARSGSVETIIFDEVDSGISGATAAVIGEKLLALAQYHQMLCITHLPQIASQGENHFLVKKEVAQGRTQTVISETDAGARVQEIARLLGGREITPAAVARAKEMLGQ